ncbi:molecular chaperone DnaJ [Succinimonas amylolytica]|uniref:molecular chaperone DnaJ n=1 Tax=Succinimonas amylolytica TaxID=83769 RepID=UPI0023A85368
MAEKRDYYEVLGVDKSADAQTIKKAFRRLAMKYHPDRNHEAGAAQKFEEINEAYSVLSDPNKKAAYDQFGFAGVDPNNAGAGGFGGGFGGGDFSSMFGDIFGDIFGNRRGGGSGPREQPGDDVEKLIDITLEEAASGCEKQIEISTYVPCDTCHSTGCKDGSKPQTCSHCHGTGRVQMRQGFFAVEQTCPYCHGTGKEISNPCSSCQGTGRVVKKIKEKVTIPAGVTTGNRLRLNGKGEAGLNGAPSGDLYIVIRVKPHKIFERDGNDLHVEVPISFCTAALGGKVEVPTLSGRISLTISEGTQTGTRLRVPGKGIKSIQGTRTGDLYCHILVETPVKLSDEQKKILRSFEASLGEGKSSGSHEPNKDSFMQKAKKFFDDLKG